MKKMYISLAVLVTALSGCNTPDIIEPQLPSCRDFQVIGDKVDSRVFLNGGVQLCWNAGDKLSLFWSEANVKYEFCGEDGATEGPISAVQGGAAGGTLLDNTYALYPYDPAATINSDGEISTMLPEHQTYLPNSMGRDANLMVAVTEDEESTRLYLRNVCGYLRLHLYGTDVNLKNITVRGNNGEILSGDCTITASHDSEPAISMDAHGNESVTLDCGSTAIGNSEQNATEFIFALPPMTFTKGITISATDNQGRIFEKSTDNVVPIVRNVIQPMSAVEVIPQDWNGFNGLTAPQSIHLASSAIVAEPLRVGCSKEALTIETSAQWMGVVGNNTSVAEGAIADLQLWAEPNFSTQTRYADITITGANSAKSVNIQVSQAPYLRAITESLPARLETQSSSYDNSKWASEGICSPNDNNAILCAISTSGSPLTYDTGSTGLYVSNMNKGDYMLYAIPTKSVKAGDQIDFMCTVASISDADPKYYIFEYWDNDQWNSIEESLQTAEVDSQTIKYSIYCNKAYDHNSTYTQSFTLSQPIENGCVKVRLRDLNAGNGAIRIPSGKGYMGMYAINYPDAPAIIDSKKMLFIGNSFTYYYGTAFMFKEIARSQGHQVDAVISVKGSQEFNEHLNLQLSLNAIQQGGYDYAFLQDSSPNAAYYADADYNQDTRTKIINKSKEINALTLQYSHGCQIVYERTWACPYSNYRGYGSYEKLDCLLKKGSEMLQDEVGANIWVSPIGLGFRVGREEGLNLLYTDDRHQNRAGAYMKACINYLLIYGERFTSDVSDCAVDAATAAKIREIAERVVFDGVAETANCYIVKPGQSFSFLADLMGNGNIPAGSQISSADLDGKSVKVLWSSYNTTTAPASNNDLISGLTLKNGIVSFTAGSRSGNAVIALCDNSGKVLWSWHIWICDGITDQTYNGYTWMDRNLGALSAAKGNDLTLGLLYQFGRKDPFRGSAKKDANTYIQTTGTWPTAVNQFPGSAEAYAIANPMQLISRQNSTLDDWFSADAAGQNHALWSSSGKTMYDPCPRGYRVPEKYAWNVGHTAGAAFFTSGNFTYDSSNLCRTYSDGNITVVYPIAGCLSGSSGELTNVGTTGYYRTANKATEEAHAEILEIGASSINTSKGNYRSSAYSVRCVKE